MKRLITGIQPSGNITLGNYIGSIRNLVKLQEGVKYFHLTIDGKDTYIKNGNTVKIKDGSKVVFIKVLSTNTKDYNVAINFKGWFPNDVNSNDGDDRGYVIVFPPKNMMKKYSVNKNGKVYPVVAHHKEKDKDIAKIYIELE